MDAAGADGAAVGAQSRARGDSHIKWELYEVDQEGQEVPPHLARYAKYETTPDMYSGDTLS